MSKKDTTENATIIDNVVLTPDAKLYLKCLQDSNNDVLKEIREHLFNSISLFILACDHVTEDLEKQMLEEVKYINYFNNDLKSLMKP